MIETIPPKTLAQRLDAGESFQLVDVRSPQEYGEGHVPCAMNLPMEQVASRLSDLHHQAPLVLICHSGTRATMTALQLEERHGNLVVLEGGTSAWIQAGLPTVGAGTSRLSLIRQVQILVGSLGLLGALLAFTLDIRWLWLSAAMAGGLIFAGLTGFCPMAAVLAGLPWNRARCPLGEVGAEAGTGAGVR